MNEFVGRAEAARMLGVSLRAIDGYRRRRFLRAYKIRGSRLVRFRMADVFALLEPLSAPADSEIAGGPPAKAAAP